VLAGFERRDPVAFTDVFGPSSADLLRVATAETRADRSSAIAGESMASPAWTMRFVAAGADPSCVNAQNEVAIEQLLRPMARLVAPLGCMSDRALAIALDVVIAHGVGGGCARLATAASPVRSGPQIDAALGILGFGSLAAFQQATPGSARDGVLDLRTLAGLCSAVRADGRVALAGPGDFCARVVNASIGAARDRRVALLRSAAFTDRELVGV
jgi:hypothetical protein